MTNTNDSIAGKTETENEPRTFLVWELAALYTRLGLVAAVAEKAAIADLRMFNSAYVENQCPDAA